MLTRCTNWAFSSGVFRVVSQNSVLRIHVELMGLHLLMILRHIPNAMFWLLKLALVI